MSLASSLNSTGLVAAPEPLKPITPQSSFPRRIFVGPEGLRAGWRALMFLTLFGSLMIGFRLIEHGGVEGLRRAFSDRAQVAMTPLLVVQGFSLAFLFLCVSALVMSKIEGRKFSDYGLPPRQALGRDFWIGSFSGFVAISGALAAIFLLHGFRITGLALRGTAILSAMGAWAIAFVIAAICEEFLCRGYLQHTLASGIGFWPAALVMSGFFAFGHRFNAGENLVGDLSTGIFGLLFCLFLRYSGSLWIPVGFHAGWNWGQSLYGVPDSGIPPFHNVFSSTLAGPHWLTGGMVGPEASIFTPIALLVAAFVFVYWRRKRQAPIQKPASIAIAVA